MPREYRINEKDAEDNLRNIGYELESAIADIIDNSIDAGASKIFIEYSFRTDNDEGYLAVADNGKGMNEENLISAFSYEKNKNASENRLGLFGYGLKTASFSQCDKLSIITKKKDGHVVKGMVDRKVNNSINHSKTIHDEFDDPNHLTSLLIESNQSEKPFLNHFNQGTIVMWSEINDRLGRSLRKNANIRNFYDIHNRIENHLSLVFFEKIKKEEIQIFVGRQNWDIKPIGFFDPFMSSDENSQELEEENVSADYLEGTIKIKPYIVPDETQFTEEKREQLTNYYQWNSMQGIYIFMNGRLLNYGKWHGLKYKNEKLKESSSKYRNLRIKVSLTNLKNLEDLGLTINKSNINLPIDVTEKLNIMLVKIINEYNRRLNKLKIKKIFVYRGKDRSLWKKDHNNNLVIDRAHPITKELISDDLLEKKFKQFLSLLNQQQKNYNLINIILKFQEPNYSNEEMLNVQIDDMATQLKEQLKNLEDVIQIIVSLYGEYDSKISYNYVEKRLKNHD